MNDTNIPIFVHIPKTAGSTLRSILRKQYSVDEICFGNNEEMIEKLTSLKEEEIARIKCLHGHFHYGIHQYIQKKQPLYYTMLRDPVEHVISEYYFILRKPNNMSHEKVKDMSFEEFVTSEEFMDRTSNRQTFFISGGQKDNLEKAKENIKNFSVVGITEMFEESIFLISQELGWDDISYRPKNVTKYRPTRKDFPSQIIESIKNNNQLDYELYNHAKDNIQERIQNLNYIAKRKLKKYILTQQNPKKSRFSD